MLVIPAFLFSTPILNNVQDVKAGIEFQWNQDSVFKRLKWFQKENTRRYKNKIYFFLRPSDRNADLIKINLRLTMLKKRLPLKALNQL